MKKLLGCLIVLACLGIIPSAPARADSVLVMTGSAIGTGARYDEASQSVQIERKTNAFWIAEQIHAVVYFAPVDEDTTVTVTWQLEPHGARSLATTSTIVLTSEWQSHSVYVCIAAPAAATGNGHADLTLLVNGTPVHQFTLFVAPSERQTPSPPCARPADNAFTIS